MMGLLLCAACMLAAAGCGGGGGAGTAPRRAPHIDSFTVSPTVMSFAGGNVMITAVVSDPNNEQLTVKAAVARPDGLITTLPAITDSAGKTFTFDYNAATNSNSAGQDAIYSVVVMAANVSGFTTSSDTQQFTVRAPLAPPPAPPPPGA